MLISMIRMLAFVLVGYLVYLGLALIIAVGFGQPIGMVGAILLAAVGGCAGYFAQREVARRITAAQQATEEE